MSPPDAFGPDFLEWLREATERAWATPPPSPSWPRAGARWGTPLDADELARVEARVGAPFPDDYRLFLRTLHAVEPRPLWSFTDWRDEDQPAAARTWLEDGILFDVEVGTLWLPRWGPQPSAVEDRLAIARSSLAAAPPIVPVIGHRYLPLVPCRSGNPVLSIHQSDTIVYGRDLRTFLLNELYVFLGRESRERDFAAEVDRATLPFWGELLDASDPR